MTIKAILSVLGLLILIGNTPGQAAEEPSTNYVEYVELVPAFTTNYGGPGRLRFLKAEVSIKVTSREAEDAINRHMPYIRNNLVMLLSSQSEDDVSTAVGKEKMRQQALEEVRNILAQEEGEGGYSMATDLLFTSFVIQR